MTKKRSFILFNHQFIKHELNEKRKDTWQKNIWRIIFSLLHFLFFHPSILRLAYSILCFLAWMKGCKNWNEWWKKNLSFAQYPYRYEMKRWSIILESIKINCMWSLPFSQMLECQRDDDGQTCIKKKKRGDDQCLPMLSYQKKYEWIL